MNGGKCQTASFIPLSAEFVAQWWIGELVHRVLAILLLLKSMALHAELGQVSYFLLLRPVSKPPLR